MDFSDPPRRRSAENLLPMINVVFLLLIFFLISARLTPPEPFAVTPPQSQAVAEAMGEFTLYIGADAQQGYRDQTGDAALAVLRGARDDHCRASDCTATPPRLTLRADVGLPAASLAALLPELSGLGFSQIELVVQAGGGT